MAYQQQRGGNQTPRKTIIIGALWSDQNDDGLWIGKGSLSNQIEGWMADLLLDPSVKIAVYPNNYKNGNPKAPDYNVCLSVPEDILPQEYYDWLEARESSRGVSQPPQRGGYAQPPMRGGYQQPAPRRQVSGQRSAPSQRQPAAHRGGYVDGRSDEHVPPTRGGYPRQAPPPRGRPVQNHAYDEDDLSDPFAE